MSDNTGIIVDRHWNALCRQDLAQLIANHAEDAVLITGVTASCAVGKR